jgi:hypothetical protein
MTCCPNGCLVCEVDGLPVDPARAAELAERDRLGKAAYEAFLAAPAAPAPPRTVDVPPQRLTARQRGLARRMRLVEIEPAWDPLSWQVQTTGFADRRSLTTGRRGARYPKRQP